MEQWKDKPLVKEVRGEGGDFKMGVMSELRREDYEKLSGKAQHMLKKIISLTWHPLGKTRADGEGFTCRIREPKKTDKPDGEAEEGEVRTIVIKAEPMFAKSVQEGKDNASNVYNLSVDGVPLVVDTKLAAKIFDTLQQLEPFCNRNNDKKYENEAERIVGSDQNYYEQENDRRDAEREKDTPPRLWKDKQEVYLSSLF